MVVPQNSIEVLNSAGRAVFGVEVMYSVPRGTAQEGLFGQNPPGAEETTPTGSTETQEGTKGWANDTFVQVRETWGLQPGGSYVACQYVTPESHNELIVQDPAPSIFQDDHLERGGRQERHRLPHRRDRASGGGDLNNDPTRRRRAVRIGV